MNTKIRKFHHGHFHGRCGELRPGSREEFADLFEGADWSWQRDPRERGHGPRFYAGPRRDRSESDFEERGRGRAARWFGGGGPGHLGGFGGFEGGGFGRGRGRMFDAGDLKLVVLKLLSEQPSYGYQLIKTMEQRLAGGYSPSAGVIYPTLTLLEEEGLAAVSTENNKKVYSVTAEGTQYLESSKRRVEEIFSRLDETGRGFERGRSPELIRAFANLRGAVAARVSRGSLTEEQIRKIADAVNAAAKTIDEF
jgi:DNA-binding PadR family transcriptional regulator